MIGDGVLRHVFHVLLFGTTTPAAGTLPPPYGYSVEDAGLAASLVSCSV